MQILRTEDPRDRLAKARRTELVKFARANGMKDIDPNMPAELIRGILRQCGLTNIQIPNRVLGQPNQPHGNAPLQSSNAPVVPTQGIEVNALADLARQYKAEQERAAASGVDESGKPLKDMSINELRKICQGLGIHLGRRDNMATMREKIEAERGKNPA